MDTNNNNDTNKGRPRWFGPALIALVLLLVGVAGWIIRDLTAPNEAEAPGRSGPGRTSGDGPCSCRCCCSCPSGVSLSLRCRVRIGGPAQPPVIMFQIAPAAPSRAAATSGHTGASTSSPRRRFRPAVTSPKMK